MNFGTEVAGIHLEHPIMNAAGTCKSIEDVKKLSRSATSAIMLGSITKEVKPGNPGNTYWASDAYSLNSLGLPNLGAEYFREHLPEMVEIAHASGKPLFVSVAGFEPIEYAELATLAFAGGADLVELNLGCPNVWQGSTQKRIACFDPDLVSLILDVVGVAVGREAKVAIKISPFSDPFALAELAMVLNESVLVKVISTANTFPNAFAYDDSGKSRITFGTGLAGMAGPAMKPIGLGQVRQWRELISSHQIIGVGGITHGRDVWEYLGGGVAAVQVATAYLGRGENIFSSLLAELVEVYGE